MDREEGQEAREADDQVVWGIRAIAEVLNTSERKTFYLAERGLIDVSKVGARYVSTARRLRRSLGIGEVA